MSNEIKAILAQLSAEAGIVVPDEEAKDALLAAAIDELSLSGAENISHMVTKSHESATIAEQLDDLADRAEIAETQAAEADEIGDTVGLRVAEVTVESLSREFDFVLSVNGLNQYWSAPSLESKATSAAKAGQLKTDARRYASVAKKAVEQLSDLSNEAAGLVKFLAAHKMRLGRARTTLHNTLSGLSAASAELKDHPHPIPHNQIGGFMTRLGKQVTDLPAAIHAESEYLKRVSNTIDEALTGLLHALQQLEHNPDADLLSVIPHGLTEKLTRCITQKGELMGNHSVIMLDSHNRVVPHFKRVDDKTLSKEMQVAMGGAAVGIGGFVGTYAAGMLGLVIGGTALGAVGVLAGGAAAAAAVGTSWHRNATNLIHDTSKTVSIATADGLKKAIGEVLDYSKYTDTKLDDGPVLHKLDELDKLHGIAKTGAAAHVVDAIWSLGQLNEILYDQALYTTLHMATVANHVS